MADEYPVIAKVLSSDGVTRYSVRRAPDGELFCECKAAQRRVKCRHLVEAREGDWCPACALPLDYDEVDIGVGTLKGDFRCPDCGWRPNAYGEDVGA